MKKPDTQVRVGRTLGCSWAAHSPALDFPPLAWTPTVFGTDQLNRAGSAAQAWRRVSQTRPGLHPLTKAAHTTLVHLRGTRHARSIATRLETWARIRIAAHQI